MTVACPACAREMERVRRGPARFWRCGGCGAHALAESALRKIVPPVVWAAIWPAIRGASAAGTRACPSCRRPMEETRDLDDAAGLRVDFCDACRLVWLDPRELDRLPQVPFAESEPPRLSANAARLLAEAIAHEYEAREEMALAPVRALVGLVRALCGLGHR